MSTASSSGRETHAAECWPGFHLRNRRSCTTAMYTTSGASHTDAPQHEHGAISRCCSSPMKYYFAPGWLFLAVFSSKTKTKSPPFDTRPGVATGPKTRNTPSPPVGFHEKEGHRWGGTEDYVVSDSPSSSDNRSALYCATRTARKGLFMCNRQNRRRRGGGRAMLH